MLLREQLFNQTKIITEGETPSGKKNLYLKGIFVQGGIRNQNQRVYPVHEISHAVQDIANQIASGISVCGELDHPEGLNINMDRISHVITEMYMDGPNGIGKLRILNTPCGNIARALIEEGIVIGVSSRGTGDVGPTGEVSNFSMNTVDIVMTPSAMNATPRPIYEQFINHNTRGAIREDIARAVSHDDAAQKFLKEELMKLIQNIK